MVYDSSKIDDAFFDELEGIVEDVISDCEEIRDEGRENIENAEDDEEREDAREELLSRVESVLTTADNFRAFCDAKLGA